MARRKSSSHRLAQQVTELAFAAPQVVAQRTARMARAGALPSRADQDEFLRMGSEKVDAFYQSWTEMWMAGWRVPFDIARASTLAPASGYALLATSAMGVLSAGLAPVRKRAVSNAKRLARRRKMAGSR